MEYQQNKNILKVGVFLIVMLTISGIFIAGLSNENKWFEEKTTLRINLKNAENLKPGADVQFKGLKIGKVIAIKIESPEYIQILTKISKEYAKWVKVDSYAKVISKGLVGDKMLEIVGGSSGADSVNENDTPITSKGKDTSMNYILKQGSSAADNINTFVHKLNLILDKSKLNETLSNLNSSSEKIDRFLTYLDKKQTVQKIDKLILSLSKISTQVEKGPGTLNSLIYSNDIAIQVEQILGGASKSSVLKYFIQKSLEEAPKR